MNDIKLKAKQRLQTEVDASTSTHNSDYGTSVPNVETVPVAKLGNGGSKAVGLAADPGSNAVMPDPNSLRTTAVARLRNSGSMANAVKARKTKPV